MTSMVSGEVEILCGTEASLALSAAPEQLRWMVEEETRETWERPRGFCNRLRAWFHGKLAFLAAQLGDRVSRAVRPPLDRLYPPDRFFAASFEEELAWALDEADRLLAQDQFVCARRRGELIGMVAYKLGGRWHDGRDVYELTKAYVVPRFRGRWVYARLQRKAIECVRTAHLGALIMALSKNPALIALLSRLNWRPLSLAQYSEITRRVGRTGMAPAVAAAFPQWQALLWDPDDQAGGRRRLGRTTARRPGGSPAAADRAGRCEGPPELGKSPSR